MNPLRAVVPAIVLLLGLGLLGAPAEARATLPDGFRVKQVARGLTMPVDLVAAADGRLFIAEKRGRVKIRRTDGQLVTMVRLRHVAKADERGLTGIALDPDFADNGYVYLAYTHVATRQRPVHLRVARVTVEGNRAVPDSLVLLRRLDGQRSTHHMGGALDFGPDGKLYVTTGDNQRPGTASRLTSLLGKVLRLNPDGTIPSDNPFYDRARGSGRAVWARGLRNPFKLDFRGSSDVLFINDVGEHTWEEINRGRAGVSFGWPRFEGPEKARAHTPPVHSYRSTGRNCAITGGAFYDPADARFPASYSGDYFYADLCGGWIRRYDVASDTSRRFAVGFPSRQLVDLAVSPAGDLFALRLSGVVTRIRYAG